MLMALRRLLQLCLLGLLTIAAHSSPTKIISGKLVVPPQAGTKNSYMTGNFQILTRDARLVLTSSKQVSEEELLKFKDRFVTLEVIDVPSRPADPNEQAPMSQERPDGPVILVAHPAHYQVVRIKPFQGIPFTVYQGNN